MCYHQLMATYTDTQKAEAVTLYLEHGTAEASKHTGISGRSITRWANATGLVSQDRQKTDQAREQLARRNAERREHVKTLLLEKAEDLLGRMDQPHIDFKGGKAEQVTYPIATSGDVKNYAVAVAVLIDKYRLESGEATGRVETVELAAAESRIDQEIERLSSQLENG